MRVGIAGTTTWGTTLGLLLAHKGAEVALWARSQAEADRINTARRNEERLPGHELPASMRATADPGDLAGAEFLIAAVPSASMRTNARAVADTVGPDMIVVSATKGLERETSKRMSEVIEEEIPAAAGRIAVLSGPNLAREILDGHPASTVIAATDEGVAEQTVSLLMSPRFRAYTNADVVGVELGGALKNIVAIGAGMSDGLGFGDNAKAGLVTRGLAEITRLGVAAGARPMTFAGTRRARRPHHHQLQPSEPQLFRRRAACEGQAAEGHPRRDAQRRRRGGHHGGGAADGGGARRRDADRELRLPGHV